MHFVFESCVVIAFSRSSKPPLFFSFFTKLLTAFSDHFSSLSLLSFFQPSNRFTIGGVNASIDVVIFSANTQLPLTLCKMLQCVFTPLTCKQWRGIRTKIATKTASKTYLTSPRHFSRRRPDRCLSLICATVWPLHFR